MRGVHLGATGHAEQVAEQLHLALDAGADLHLRVHQLAVTLAELLRQRDLGVGFLRRIDPQVEQRARRSELAAGFAAFGELAFEAHEGVLADAEHQLVVRVVPFLQFDLRRDQRLQALLVLTVHAEGRHAQQAEAFLAQPAHQHPTEHRIEHRHGLRVPLVEPGLAATGHALEQCGERIAALPAHGLLPGTGDVGRGGVAAGELPGDLLHHAQPLPGLGREALDHVGGLVAATGAGHPAPGIESGLPRVLRRLRLASERAHGVAEGVHPLPRHRFGVARHPETRTTCSPHRIAPDQERP